MLGRVFVGSRFTLLSWRVLNSIVASKSTKVGGCNLLDTVTSELMEGNTTSRCALQNKVSL